VGANSDVTFHSQSTFVLPVKGRYDTFVFMADRWKEWDLPDSRYVWLPLEFTGEGRPVLYWREHWSLDTISPTQKALVTATNKVSSRFQ
jgi:hypothetical protein